LAQQAGVPFIGSVPMDPSVRIGGDAGQPITVTHPQSAAARALEMIAMDLAAKISVAAVQGQNNVIPISMVG
jgi:ATP-binding protein involved in chromosome partitioning